MKHGRAHRGKWLDSLMVATVLVVTTVEQIEGQMNSVEAAMPWEEVCT
jgi:hypothetical protein